MFELFWAIWAIPKVIYPVACANGRSGIRWVFYTIGIFLSIEITILTVYFSIYYAVIDKYNLPKHPEYFWLTYLVYFIALLSGLLSVDLIRRYLTKKDEIYKPIYKSFGK